MLSYWYPKLNKRRQSILHSHLEDCHMKINIDDISLSWEYLSSNRLQKHCNSHPWWKCMGVDNQIWTHPRNSRKWHIDIWPQLGANTFLTMSTAKFVTDDGVSRMSKTYIHLLKNVGEKIKFLNISTRSNLSKHYILYEYIFFW
jgi:hypothetical protein